MPHKSGFNKDDFDVTQSRITTGHTYRFRYGFVIIMGLVVVFLGSIVAAFGINPGCGSMALNASCSSPVHPIVGSSPTLTTTVPLRSAPTATSTAQPRPSPTAGGSSSLPFPMLTDEDQVTNDVRHYEVLVFKKDFNKAYNLLDVSVREQVTYDDFINNASYVLNNQCWLEGKLTVSQRDNQNWDASIPMAQVSCAHGTVQVSYSWHFTVRMVDGLPEIMSVGLYPNGN